MTTFFAVGAAGWQSFTIGGGGTVEYDYKEITANVTTTAGPTTAITGASVTYDGATRVKIEVFAPALFVGANGLGIRVSLYDGAAVVADIGGLYINSGTTVSELDSPSLYAQRLLTPSAGAHQYIVKIYVAAGSGTVGLGAGTSGSGNFCPAFLRITSA